MRTFAWGGPMGLAVLVLAGGLTFANVFGNSWHYDDKHSIVENPHLRTLAEPLRFFTDPTQFSRDADKAMFRPLLLTSFALNHAWSGLDTSSWHVVNLALHLACALVLWRILLRLGRSPETALVGGLLFCLHPLATEPVNYISSRSESMAALFVLLSFWLHLRARTDQSMLSRSLSIICLGLGVLTKSVAITGIALVVLHDGLRDGWHPKRLAQRLTPYLLVAVGYMAIVGAHVSRAVVTDAVRGPVEQLATQMKAAPYYVKLLLFPVGLNVHHQFFSGGAAIVVVPALLCVVSIAVLLARAPRDLRLGVMWGAIAMAPTVVVPLHVLVNDHRLYLPLAGLTIALTSLRLPRSAAAPLAVVGLLVLAATTHVRNGVWENEYTLWSDAAAKSPNPLVPVAYVHLGNYAKEAGRPEEAVGYFEKALEIAPEHVAARNNMGIALQALGRVDEAITLYRGVLQEQADVDEAWYNLGKAYQQRAQSSRDSDMAFADYGRARQAYGNVGASSPHYHVVLNNTGTVFEFAGAIDSAAHYYRRSLQQQPQFVDAINNMARLRTELPARAQALLAVGAFDQVAGLCEELLAAGQGPRREAMLFLAASRLYQGRIDDSRQVNEQLLQQFPAYEEGYLQLGNLYETTGDPESAATVYAEQLKQQAAGELADEARRRLARLQGAR